MAEVAPLQPSPWTVVARKDASVAFPQQPPRVFESLSSREGITVAVLDANALISTAFRLPGLADQFVTVKEALEEVRDRTSRMQLAAVPVTVDCLEPSQEALTRVIQFARGTGDIQSLSDVDLKLIALTFTLEECAHGTAHLRSKPPPLHVTRVRSIQEHQLPGWGSNVPNLEEWEEISEEHEIGPDQELLGEVQIESHILGLKTLSLESSSFEALEDGQNHTSSESHVEAREVLNERQSQEGKESIGTRKARRQNKKNVEPQIDGKLMVAVGLDASKGEHEEIAGDGDWERAISRSTRRKYDKRKARAALLQPSAQEKQFCISDGGADENREIENETVSTEPCQSSSEEALTGPPLLNESEDSAKEHHSCGSGPDDKELKADNCLHVGNVKDIANLEHIHSDAESGLISEGDQEDGSISETEQRSARSSTECGITATPNDGTESEQSWTLRPLSKSSVACITSDFAMQNVLLQIGLRVLSPNGLQVHQLHRWVLKCQACNTVTSEVERIFCPKCGNGGTLYKISVTVGANGIVHAGRRPRTNIRGTRYSLPLPKGGRNGVIENPILREDQIPQKLLHPKKKKVSTASIDLFTSTDTFTKKIDKGQRGPPIREALAVFSGKRNPNDQLFARKH